MKKAHKAIFFLFAMQSVLMPIKSYANDDEDGFSVNFVTRAWFNRWTTWDLLGFNYTDGSYRYYPTSVSSDNEISPSYLLAVKSGRFSYSLGISSSGSDHEFKNNINSWDKSSKRAGELQIGYDLIPKQLTLNVGWVDLEQDFHSNNQYYAKNGKLITMSGPSVGLKAISPLSETVFLYGNVAISRMKTDDFPLTDAVGKEEFDARYTQTEFGLAYSSDLMSDYETGLIVSLGYRVQSVTTKDFSLPYVDKNKVMHTLEKVDLKDLTEGISLTVMLNFSD